jgi:hypothetical protein
MFKQSMIVVVVVLTCACSGDDANAGDDENDPTFPFGGKDGTIGLRDAGDDAGELGQDAGEVLDAGELGQDAGEVLDAGDAGNAPAGSGGSSGAGGAGGAGGDAAPRNACGGSGELEHAPRDFCPLPGCPPELSRWTCTGPEAVACCCAPGADSQWCS